MGNYNPKQEIVIYDGAADGYGDAVQVPGRSSYNWSYNFDTRAQWRTTPALAPIYKTSALIPNFAGRVGAVFEWEDATTLRPFLLILAGSGSSTASGWLWRDGSVVADGSVGAGPIVNGVLFRHDGSNADNEMVYITSATAPGTTAAIYQRNKAATYANTGHTISPYGIYVVGSQLWIVSANGYEVQKWTLDTDPGLSGSYGTAISVGRPTYPVTFIGNLGGSPIVVKGDGVHKYDPSPSTAQFISILDFSSPHKENGLGSGSDGRGRLYIPTVEGHLVVVTAGFQSLQTPARNKRIDRDTPYGRITAIACDLENVWAAIEPGQRYTDWVSSADQGASNGIKVIADDGGVRTDETSDVTDGQFSTVADIHLLTAGDYIYVGSDRPFWGAYFTMYAGRTSAFSNAITVDYTTGAATWTAANNSHDSTCSFERDGLITMQPTGNTDVYASGAWAKTTAYSGSATKYWMRIQPQTTLTGAQIAEVRLVPYRPPLDTAVMPETGPAMAGALVPILAGTWRGEELIWNHVYTLDTARIDKMVIGNGTCGALTSKRGLYCVSSEGVVSIPIGPDAIPARASWPKLADYSDSTVAADTHAIGFSAIDFGAVVEFTDGLQVDMTGVETDDVVRVYCRWDEDAAGHGYDLIWEEKKGHKFFTTAPPPGVGRILYTYLQYTDGSRTPLAPVLHSVKIPKNAWREVDTPMLAEQNQSIALT